MYCYSDSHVQDEERRHQEVPRFCVNSLVEAEKAWTPSLLVMRSRSNVTPQPLA